MATRKKKASPVSLVGLSLRDLGALELTRDNRRDGSLMGLRNSVDFQKTGRVPKSFDGFGHREGIAIQIEKGDNARPFLQDGRHRFTVAREFGLPSVWGTVRRAGTGRVLFRGQIPIAVRPRCRTIAGVRYRLVVTDQSCPRGRREGKQTTKQRAKPPANQRATPQAVTEDPKRAKWNAESDARLRAVGYTEAEIKAMHRQTAQTKAEWGISSTSSAPLTADEQSEVELSRLSAGKLAEPWTGRVAQKQVLSNVLRGREATRVERAEIVERMSGRALNKLGRVVAEVLGRRGKKKS